MGRTFGTVLGVAFKNGVREHWHGGRIFGGDRSEAQADEHSGALAKWHRGKMDRRG